MKSKSNNWERVDLQQNFWKGVIDYLSISDALILQFVSSFFKSLIYSDLWQEIANKVGRMVSKDQSKLQCSIISQLRCIYRHG